MEAATHVPKQTLPKSKKTDQWHKNTIDAYINIANVNPVNTTRRRDIYEYYEAYNGIINDRYYTHVTKPYGKKRQNFPAKLHRYNIIKPLVDQLLGEKAKRPINYNVMVSNPDVYNRKIKAKKELLQNLLKQEYVDMLQQEEISRPGQTDNERDREASQNIQEIMERFEAEYNDTRAISGQQALDYIYYYNEMYNKLQKGWKDFIIAGEVFTERIVESHEPVYRILNPLDVDYDMDPDLEFVEDAEWALIREQIHVSSVVDMFYDELTKDEIADLESNLTSANSNFSWVPRRNDSRDVTRDRTVEVITVYWKCRKKVGFVTWLEDGELFEKEVEEGYELNEDLGEEVEWKWVNEVRQGVRINDRIYKRMGVVEPQRGSLDNPSRCKLPINGRTVSDRNAPNVSLVALMLPYQIAYDIYKYRLDISIAKSKDVIAQLDIDSIPDEWDMDKFMYYVDATGIAWTQSNKTGYQPNPAHRSVIDLTVKTIESYLALLESIIIEMERSVGISRQRQGKVSPYDGKGTTEQAIIQSSHITEDYFRKFAWLEQRDFQALLDISKPAWIMGKKSSYFMDDSSMKILQLDGIEHASSEYAVFVVDAREEQEKIEAARGLAQPMIQNGVTPSSVLSVFESKNFAEVRKKLKEAEDMQARLEEARREAEQAAVRANTQLELEKLQMEAVDNEKDRAMELEKTAMELNQKQSDNETKREIEQMKEQNKKNIAEQERRLEERKLAVEKALKREELAIKRRSDIQKGKQ